VLDYYALKIIKGFKFRKTKTIFKKDD